MFRTKPEIALDRIRAALAAGTDPGVVLIGAGYCADTGLRSEITALACAMWPHGRGPLPPKAWSGRGRPPAGCAATARTSRFSSRRWRSSCLRRSGRQSPGAKARPTGSSRALPGCGCVPPIATSDSADRGTRNGC
ncbi:MAG: transposase [Dehalococcoidia bacterium]